MTPIPVRDAGASGEDPTLRRLAKTRRGGSRGRPVPRSAPARTAASASEDGAAAHRFAECVPERPPDPQESGGVLRSFRLPGLPLRRTGSSATVLAGAPATHPLHPATVARHSLRALAALPARRRGDFPKTPFRGYPSPGIPGTPAASFGPVVLVLLAFVLAGAGIAQGGTCPDANPSRNPYFGDTHVHTRLSMDANTQDTRMSPAEAHAFARGERVPLRPFAGTTPLRWLRLARPLDFVALSDHAEFFGEIAICDPRYNPEGARHPGYDSPECRLFRDRPDEAFIAFNFFLATGPTSLPTEPKRVRRLPFCGVGGETCVTAGLDLWAEARAAANQANEPCAFTAFIGYEWSGSPSTRNLHRNVIFRNAHVPAVPMGYMEAPEPELLWDALDGKAGAARACLAADGCDVLTIPHNSNLSNGLMFETRRSDGAPFDVAYAARRARAEPLVEIFQHKGDSECFRDRGAGRSDELCGFEKFPYNNLIADRFGGFMTAPPRERDFVRDALKTGLALERDLGVNPFRYGVIASTDTHQGTPGAAVEDARYFGHGGAGPASRGQIPAGLQDSPAFNPGGLAVVWADENTRDSIFDAMERRETYGTSGPRMLVRFFGGYEYEEASLCGATPDPGERPDEPLADAGYAGGVPMGGELAPVPGRKPRFAVLALRDPGHPGESPDPGTFPGDLGALPEPSVPLERIQIVKGWIDAGGVAHEQVVDVAGEAAPEGSIDPEACDPPAAGPDRLCRVWEDAGFDPAEPAFYYARVLQHPTCRWTTLQCNAGRAAAAADGTPWSCDDPDSVPAEWEGCCDPRWPKTVRERAWTSPIWYTPPS